MTPEQEEAARVAHDAEPALPCPGPMDGLQLRRRLGRKQWGIPEEFGCCGWMIHGVAGGYRSTIRVTGDHQSETWTDLLGETHGHQWIHASIGQHEHMPTYEDMQLLHRAVFGDGWAYEVFAPPADHINIHSYVRHLFGRYDGARVLPDFGRFGTI